MITSSAQIISTPGSTPGSGNSGTVANALPSIASGIAGDIVTVDGSGNLQDTGTNIAALTLVASVRITAAQLKAISTNPITLVPAPGAGFTILPLSITASFDPGTTIYVDAQSVNWGVFIEVSGNSTNPISATANSGSFKIASIVGSSYGITQMTRLDVPATLSVPNAVSGATDNGAVIFATAATGTGPITTTTLTGAPATFSIAYPGKGYAVNDVVQVTAFVQSSPGVLARLTVTGVDTQGSVTGVSLTLSASHSTIVTFPCKFLPTTAISGGGTGLYLNVLTSVGGTNGIAASHITAGNAGVGYAAGDTGTVTFTGATVATYVIDTVSLGAVVTYHLTSVGAGYIIGGAYVTATGGSQAGIGTGFQIDVTALGGGYAANDTGTFTGGGGNATYVVDTVDANGNVVTYHLSAAGTGYTKGSYYPGAKGGGQAGVGLGFGIAPTATAVDPTAGDGTLVVNVIYAIVKV